MIGSSQNDWCVITSSVFAYPVYESTLRLFPMFHVSTLIIILIDESWMLQNSVPIHQREKQFTIWNNNLILNAPQESDIGVFTCISSDGFRNDFIVNVLSEPRFPTSAIDGKAYRVSERSQLEIDCQTLGNPSPMVRLQRHVLEKSTEDYRNTLHLIIVQGFLVCQSSHLRMAEFQ